MNRVIIKIQKCIDDKSHSLDLSGMNISQLPEIILDCNHIKTLDLSQNKFHTLPDIIINLKNLHHLFLGYNEFNNFPINVLSLTNLKTLSIKKNQIEEIPKEINKLKELELLSLSNNSLKTLPETIGELTHLKRISLFGNNFINIPYQIGNLINTQIDIDDARLLRNAFQNISGSYKQSILLPNEIKIAFVQYLNFFEEYYSITNKRFVNVKILSIKDGLEVEILPSEEYTIDEILKNLDDYMRYLKYNIDTLKIDNERIINKNKTEIAILEKDLKNEIRILKMRIENKNFNIKILQETNDTLIKALNLSASQNHTIQIYNNIDNTNKQIIKTNPVLEQQLQKFVEHLLSIKNISRDVLVENEVEKLLSVIQEVKSATSKKELKNINFLEYAQEFIKKIENKTTSLGQIFKSINNSASIILGLKDTFTALNNTLSNLF